MDFEKMKFWTKKSLAELMSVSEITLDRRRREGKLPFHLIGKKVIFSEQDVETFLKNTEASITVGAAK
jgi:excisionase family DNA binding protein